MSKYSSQFVCFQLWMKSAIKSIHPWLTTLSTYRIPPLIGRKIWTMLWRNLPLILYPAHNAPIPRTKCCTFTRPVPPDCPKLLSSAIVGKSVFEWMKRGFFKNNFGIIRQVRAVCQFRSLHDQHAAWRRHLHHFAAVPLRRRNDRPGPELAFRMYGRSAEEIFRFRLLERSQSTQLHGLRLWKVPKLAQMVKNEF